MKKLVLIFLTAVSLSGCKKAVQNQAEDLVLQAMTDGKWIITNFTQNGTNITTDFTGFQFQYYANKTVDAIYNGTVQKTGNWDGSATTMSTWANFANPAYPLVLINGTWHIDNNSWTYVAATQTNGSETKTMRLEKQ